MLTPEYAITRPYPWRHFGPIFFVASCIVFVLLTLLNAAVAGYETVTVARSDKNVTQQMWWTPVTPRALRAKTTCDSYLLNVGDTFTTNASLFQWTLLDASSYEGAHIPEAGFQYSAEPMAFCSPSSQVSNVDVDINVATVATWTYFMCDTTSGVLFQIQGTWQWSIVQSGIENVNVPEISTIYLPLHDVLSRLAQDLFEALLAPAPPGNEGLVRLSVQGPVSWTNGSSSYDAGLGYTTPALRNFLKASMAAAEIDLGIYNENSLYFDMEMFNATIEPNPLLTGSHFMPVPGEDDLNYPYFVFSSIANNLSGAQILRMYPASSQNELYIPIDRDLQNPAIIEVSYLCHDLQIKSPLAFASSVFVGTVSMFMAFRAFVVLIATLLAKRHSEKSNYCEGSLALEEGRSLPEGREMHTVFPSIGVPENDVVLEPQRSEPTLSVQPMTSHRSKDDGLAVYDTENDSQLSSELSTLLGKNPEET
ncbi:hypothetical protein JAAARDRAFT_403059 [Jaapia argillacea MUCL 33604]|uniref:Uncharacterized protein n=1 Tax=Jaapia argillacea MUCL 33604 TaxID=933084 RepID=A0A067PV81_9AGAM|nr:hypothetical protein JAAARDRAFT_403059 [Jaapia argillacea MUCL 33604]